MQLPALLRILVHDLLVRAGQYRDQLSALPAAGPRASHRQRCMAELDWAARMCANLLSDRELGAGLHGEAQLSQFQRQARRIGSVAFVLPILERFTDHDAALTILAARIGGEVGLPLHDPLVTAANVDYYGTQPDLGLIVAPSLSRLVPLEFPDLVHELLHLLWHGREADRNRLEDAALYHFAQAAREAARSDRPPQQREALAFGAFSWTDNVGTPWLLELACDAGAAFVCGPAYAWQNVRLCAAAPDPIYGYGAFERASHPPSAIRMTVMLSVVRSLGFSDDADQVGEAWSTLLTGLGVTKPDCYDDYCPHELAEEIAQQVEAMCRQVGIRAFSREEPGTACRSIVGVCDEAWRRFISDVESYPEWEAGVEAQMRRELATRSE